MIFAPSAVIRTLVVNAVPDTTMAAAGGSAPILQLIELLLVAPAVTVSATRLVTSRR